jgi:hypothetical protein
MGAIILPERTMAWNALPYTFPINPIQTDYSTSSWVAKNCNGFPAIVAPSASDPFTQSLIQFDENDFWTTVLTRSDNGRPIIGDNNIFFPVTSQGKGVIWHTYGMAINGFGYPDPSFPDGICVGAFLFTGNLNPVCFPEGGISCSTTDGGVFIGTDGYGSAEQHVLDSGAGCPVTNNYGASLVSAYSNGTNGTSYTPRNLSTYQASSLGRSPLTANDDVNVAVNWFNPKNLQACDLGNNMIAILTGPSSYSGNPTLLRVFRFTVFTVYPNVGACNGKLEIYLELIYEKDLMDFMPKPRPTYYSAGSLISPAPGVLTVSVQQGPGGVSARRFIFMKFPGPIIQPIVGPIQASPSTGWNLFLTQSQRIVYFTPDVGGPTDINYYAYSTDALILDYSVTLPSRNNITPVNRTNTLTYVSR